MTGKGFAEIPSGQLRRGSSVARMDEDFSAAGAVKGGPGGPAAFGGLRSLTAPGPPKHGKLPCDRRATPPAVSHGVRGEVTTVF